MSQVMIHIVIRTGQYPRKDEDMIFKLNFTILLNIPILQ